MLRITTSRSGPCFDVHVVPRASRSAIVGEHDGSVKVSLASPPVDGAANEALIELLAKALGRPRRDVAIVRGASSRKKTWAVAGLGEAELRRELERLVGDAR